MTPQEYRANVLARETAAWPQPITAQTLRTRLAAYKSSLRDANLDLGVCASCAREKRICKMIHASFPPLCGDEHPPWLAWTQDEWLLHRLAWYDQIGTLLDINVYLESFFFFRRHST